MEAAEKGGRRSYENMGWQFLYGVGGIYVADRKWQVLEAQEDIVGGITGKGGFRK